MTGGSADAGRGRGTELSDAHLPRLTGDPLAIIRGFEQMPLMLVVTEGPEHTLRALNALVRAYLEPGAIGRTYREALAGFKGQFIFEMLDRVFATGRAEVAREWRIQLRPDDPESEEFGNWSVTPWYTDDGVIGGTLIEARWVTEDVLERRAAEARLAGAEERYQAARDVVLTLQRSLLPERLPVLPKVRVAAEYRVAEAELQAGGDWFDALALEDGRLVVVVGDVVGHGARAAAAMARLSPVLHQALAAGESLRDAVDRIDRFAAQQRATHSATLVAALLDPLSGELTYVRRGHPAPVVCAGDGTVRWLDGAVAGPLGVGAGATVVATEQLRCDEVLLLYSDGLIERPGEDIVLGARRLQAVVGTAVGTRGRTVPLEAADRVCQLTAERMARTGFADDVTLLAVHRLVGRTPVLQFEQPALLPNLGFVRRRILDWLAAIGVAGDETEELALATYEAAANVAYHAYRETTPGPMQVEASLGPTGVVRIVVADRGQWRPRTAARAVGGGRGLSIMRAASDQLHVDRKGGTTITMHRRVGHPAVLQEGHASEAPPPAAEEQFTVVSEESEPPVIHVRGPVDAATADVMAHAVAAQADTAIGTLTIDVAGVTFLSSAGVQAIYELSSAYADQLRVYAPAGTPARRVLELTGLQHLLRDPFAA